MFPNSDVFSFGPGSGVLLKRRFFLYSAKPITLVSSFQFQVSSLWKVMSAVADEVSTGSGSDRVPIPAISTLQSTMTRSLPLPVLTPWLTPRQRQHDLDDQSSVTRI